MLRCRLLDLANSAARYEAIITPDKLHAYKRLVDYLALEGLCGAADKFSNAPSDASQLTYVSEGAFVTRSMAKGQRVTCVNPFNKKIVVANAGPQMSPEQVYYIKLENAIQHTFVGIAKDTQTDGFAPTQSAFGWTPAASWAAGVEKRNVYVVEPWLRNVILEVDMSSSCLACIDADSIPSASNGKRKGWMMSCSASPGLAEDVQHFFSFQFILERNS